jgi:hypothetical protein
MSVSMQSLRRARPAAPRPRWLLAPSAMPLVAGVITAIVLAQRPAALRPLFAVLILGLLLFVSVRWPRSAIVGTLILLAFLGLIRRLLIPAAGWSSYDALLLVAPCFAVVLVARVFAVGRRPLGGDAISLLIALLLGLIVLQAFNPYGGGVTGGVGGLLFFAVPLLWYFLGREYADRGTVYLLIITMTLVAVTVGVYGLWQTQVGLPPWDAEWVDVSGYAALHVGDEIRAFGTLPSSAEYASLLGAGCVFALALCWHGRFAAALALPLLIPAIVLASGRAALALTLLGMVFLAAVRTCSLPRGVLVAGVGVAVILGFAAAFGPALDRLAGQSNNALLVHQAGGLLNPLDPQQSTLLGHWRLMLDGIVTSVRHPIGSGLGSTTLGGDRLGGTTGQRTEVDISDAFVSLGLVGGLLFVSIVALTFVEVVRAYARTREPALLAVSGLMFVTLGQWLNGGHYGVSALTWFLIGWGTRSSLASKGADHPPLRLWRRPASFTPPASSPR